MSDTIKRSDAIKAMEQRYQDLLRIFKRKVKDGEKAIALDMIGCIKSLPSADRPQGEVDAIDRDALIDYCLKLIDVERKQGSDVMNYGQERVNQTEAIIDYIEHMPHINTDRPQGEWIPCSERLPSEDGQYLVWAIISFVPDHVDDPSTYQGIAIADYYGNAHPINWLGTSVEKVLAWMPLPEPWKGADDE